jgi:hypothetical protein
MERMRDKSHRLTELIAHVRTTVRNEARDGWVLTSVGGEIPVLVAVSIMIGAGTMLLVAAVIDLVRLEVRSLLLGSLGGFVLWLGLQMFAGWRERRRARARKILNIEWLD